MLSRFLAWLTGKNRRDIFQFHDGGRTRRVDPLAILRALNASPTFGDNIALIERAEGVDQFVETASTEALDTVRAAFGVRPVDEAGGLTEFETLDLFRSFCEYVAALKKNSPRWQSLLATSPTPSTPEPSATEAQPTIMPPLSGSGSTETESDFIEHCPCSGG